MRSGFNLLAAWLFVIGVVVIPAAHKLELVAAERNECDSCGCVHAHDEPDEHDAGRGHDADHCPICQLALIPLENTPPLSLPFVARVFEAVLSLPVILSVASPAYLIPYSCGPPV